MDLYLRLILYIIFGALPSLVWLFYYLQKDLHPEPKKTILKVFLLGALATVPVLFIQIGLTQILEQFNFPAHAASLLQWFVVIAFTEEFTKFLVVRLSVFNGPHIDEPVDLMMYMVVAALGFAALENVLYLFSPVDGLPIWVTLYTTASLSFIRFIGATFLHTLCSALVGYFWALASLRTKRAPLAVFLGLCLAALLHGFYDFSIIRLVAPLNLIVPVGVIVGLMMFMLYDFNEVQKIKGICKL